MNLLVSIIIPCYNASKYLNDTLQSVLSQTHSNFECIIIDDGSTDNTSLIAKNYTTEDNRFHYYYQLNAGAATARNTGIKHSAGQFIQFLDSDDLLPPDKLKIQIEFLLAHQDIDIVYGEQVLFTNTEEIDQNYILTHKNELTKQVNGKGHDLLKYFVHDNIMVPIAPLSRRKVIESISFDTTLKNCEDYDFWFQAALKGFYFSYAANPKTTCYYRRHVGNKSANSSKMNYALTVIKQKYMATIKNSYTDLYPALYKGFLLNQKRYLFGKDRKKTGDIIYTLKLAFKHKSIRLLLIDIEYAIIPNKIWNVVHWNGGLIRYMKTKGKLNQQ